MMWDLIGNFYLIFHVKSYLKSISISLKKITLDRIKQKLVGSNTIANYYNSLDPTMLSSSLFLIGD